jgi:hypothetical protein
MVGAFTPDMGIVGCRTFDGRSMTPTFHDQSLVCITQNASYIQNNIGIGKIVIAPCSYYGAGVSVIHRVHSKVNGKWVLKGDYNQILDPCHQSTSDIQWMVTGFVRNPMNDPARDIRLIFVAIIGVVSIAFWEAQSDGSK